MKNEIKAARLRLGITQDELAKRLGVTQAAISHWEKGITFPTTRQLPIVAEVLGIPIEAIFRKKAI